MYFDLMRVEEFVIVADNTDRCTAPSYTNINTKTRHSTSPSVIVVGGGLAGIAAARAFHDASFQVILLESRERIGGRVRTNYSLGFPVDMGASWLHGLSTENPLAPLIGKLGLPIYRTSGDNSVLNYHDFGEPFTVLPKDLLPEKLVRLYNTNCELVDTNGNQVPQELVFEVGKTFESILKEINKVREEFSEDLSLQQAILIVLKRKPQLRSKGLPNMVLQWYMCMMENWFAANVDTISLKWWDKEELLPGGHGVMVRGYQPIINTLATGLDIRLDHRMMEINRYTDGVKVTVENGKTFFADAAIVAVPLGVLKSNTITFKPRLPEWKEEAIADLGVGIENKIVLHFESVFWSNVEFFGVVAETSYECSYFLNLHKATGRAILVYMPTGHLAKDIEKMSRESAASFALKQLKKIFPEASAPIQYLVSYWGSDVDSLGSYSYHIVGKPIDLHDKLRIPVDNLFFAGEAASSDYPGTVHGAYSSGLMAAQECKIRVLEHYGELDLPQLSTEKETLASVPLLISRI